MFNYEVTDVELFTGDFADELFGNIKGDDYECDVSFVATLRSLLYNRMPTDHHLRLYNHRCNGKYLKNISKDTIMDHSLTVINYSQEDDDDSFDVVHEDYKQRFGDETKRLDDIAQYVQRFVNILLFTNESRHNAVVIVKDMTMRKYHFIQSMVCRLLPWYFRENKIEKDTPEFSLIKSFQEKDSDLYFEAMRKIAEKIDVSDAIIKHVAKAFARRAHEKSLKDKINTLDRIRRKIQANIDEYKMLMEEHNQVTIEYEGTKVLLERADNGEELVDFLSHMKNNITVENRDDGLRIIVSTYIEFFDTEMYRTMTKAKYPYEVDKIFHNEFDELGNRKLFMDSLFCEEPKLKVKVCGIYRLSGDGTATSYRNYAYPEKFDDRLPNPHLQIFACLGNNRPEIERALREGDVITAIQQCVSSCKSLNMTEMQQTVKPFMTWIYRCEKPIIELEDGRNVTPVEALKWLNEKEETHE